MADCFIMKYNSFNNNQKSKIIYNLPLTSNLDDISGYNRTSVYEGDTTLTISDTNGLYMYQNILTLDGSFIDSVIDNKFYIDFDIKINSSGTTKYPYYRRVLTNFSNEITCLEIYYQGSTSKNQFNLIELGDTTITKNYTTNTYADDNFHHVKMYWNLTANTIIFSIDNSDFLLGKSFDLSLISLKFGNKAYGLNGYIKNLIITT